MTIEQWKQKVLSQFPTAEFEDGPEDLIFALIGEKTVAACEYDGTYVTERDVAE